MKNLFFVIVIVSQCVMSFAQGIKGIVTDEKKEPIPFATIYIENLKTGTSSNALGKYELNLKPGSYTILFRSLGYKQVRKEVLVGNAVLVEDIMMNTESYQIKEVTITQKTEDPAYAIMRRVIAWAPYHLNQLKHYQSEVYLKGTMIIDHIPKLLSRSIKFSEKDGKEIKLKTGFAYLDESMNDITFDAPDKYKQKVKSLRSTFPENNNQPVTPIEFIKTSFYQAEILEQISPISPRSFSHYRFSYEGCSKEGDYLVDKIKVIPRRESQKLFSGYIYIVEQFWCLHSVDLKNEQFWGSIDIKQIYSPVISDAWLPISHSIRFDVSMLGVKGRYSYISTVKFTDLQINERLKGPVVAMKPEKTDDAKAGKSEAEKLLAKKDFTKKDLRKVIKAARQEEKKAKRDTVKSMEIKERRSDVKIEVDSLASKKDTSYWNTMRPVPLTIEEVKSFHVKDSVIISTQPKPKNDTTKHSSKWKIPQQIKNGLFGATKYVKPLKTSISYSGLITPKFLAFNTVDGWVYGQSLKFDTRFDSIHSFSITPVGRYAFNRKALMGSISGEYLYAPLRNGKFTFDTGINSSDFNQSTGLNGTINGLMSLFFRYNYMKLFEKRHFSLENEFDLANGLRLSTSATYMQTQLLQNTSDFSFFYRNKRDYTSNVPANDVFMLPQPDQKNSFSFSAGLTYTPEYFYKIENHRKRMVRSRFPTFTISYKKGLSGVLGSNASYHLFSGGINQRIETGNGSTLHYRLESGVFFNVNDISFSEFKHFNTQPLLVQFTGFENSFQLLDFYTYSTSRNYIEGHVQYQTDLLLLKRLPWISNTIWNENLYLNYLHTPALKNYVELGYGLGQIYLMGNLSVFGSFENGRYRSVGMRIGFRFN
jgi:hypothetical protein